MVPGRMESVSFLPNPAASSQPSPLDPGWVPRCAVFDCDGVLMDTERQWVDSVATVAREYGLADPQGLAEGLTGMTAEQIAHRVAEAVAAERLPGRASAPGSASAPGACAGDARDPEGTAPASLEAEILTALTDLDMERLSRGVDLLPGALELVRALAAVMPVAVASNSRRDVLDLKMRSGGYAPLLSTWVSTDDVPAGKPAPDMYAEAVRRMGCTPGQAVAFEDSAPGATAAVRAGTRVVGLVAADGSGDPVSAPGFPAAALVCSFLDPQFLGVVRGWTGARAARRD